MDDLDQSLLSLLAANARAPVAKLAKKLGVARSTVQARLDRLETAGVIAGYTLRLGETTRDARVVATVLLRVEPRATPTVLGRLKALPEVTQTHTTSGRFDLTLRLSAQTTADLDRVLDAIGGIPGVQDSETLIHLTTKIDRGL